MTTGSSSPEAFRCRQCGACCRWEGHVLLTATDIRRLANHLRLSERSFIERHTVLARHRAGLSLSEQPDGACIFLNGNECTVYEARPDQCREFNTRWTLRDACPVGSRA